MTLHRRAERLRCPPAESLTAPLAESASGELAAWIAAYRIEDSDPAPAGSLLEAQEREIALALRDVAADPEVRARLARRIQDSDDVEGKMDLRVLMKDPALRPLTDRLRRADSRRHLAHEMRSMMTTSGASNYCDVMCDDGSLDPGMPPLDVYMPIDEHRATWTGSEPFLVVPIVSDDEEWAIATGPGGVRLRVHIDSVPPLHTFVVTPSEGHAGSQSAAIPCIGVMQCWSATVERNNATHEYITHVQIDDPREPVLLGRPEIELHVTTIRNNLLSGGPEVVDHGEVWIPEHTWSGRCLIGRCSRWNREWRRISRGQIPQGGIRDDGVLLLDWKKVQGASTVFVQCVERDVGGGRKEELPIDVWDWKNPQWEIKGKVKIKVEVENDGCGVHTMHRTQPELRFRFPTGTNFEPTRSDLVPTSSVYPAVTQGFVKGNKIVKGGFKWYGFGARNPGVAP